MVVEYLWRVPFRVLFVAVLVVLLYLCVRVVSKLFKAYQEIFVIWTIAFGHSWKPKSKSLRIHPYFCSPAEMDEDAFDECYAFIMKAFELRPGMDEAKSKEKFKKKFFSCSYALLCRDRGDGSLRGLALGGTIREPTRTIIEGCAAVFHSHYRGGPWITLLQGALTFRELILHPFTPLYVVSRLHSYKMYLIAQHFRECYPHYAKETPEMYKQIADGYIRRSGLPEGSYDRDTFVVKRSTYRMQGNVTVISDQELKNPHIKFFNERNPGWSEGDTMVTISLITWFDMLSGFGNMIKKLLYRSKGSGAPRGIGAEHARKIQERRLQRGLTFQDASASILAAKYIVYRHGDEEGRNVSDLSSSIRSPKTPNSPEDFNINFVF